MMRGKAHNFVIAGQRVEPGEKKILQLDVAKLYDFTDMSIPIHVVRGLTTGPVLFISAAIHGDEINGSEIIRRLIRKLENVTINGSLILIPVVNIFGFNNKSRYLPDRRDLNRSFPGSPRGSLASRIAHIFMKEIVNKSTHGIDLHTGAVHRDNLPQIRACMTSAAVRPLAKAFGAPVVLNSQLRDGSLREAARKKEIPMLLYEGGEALRFNEEAIQVGVNGCLAIMYKIGMLDEPIATIPMQKSFMAKDSFWVRAPHSGSVTFEKNLGDAVANGEKIAQVQDLFGQNKTEVTTPITGIIIGCAKLPLVNKGDALYHIATMKDLSDFRGLKTKEPDLMGE